MENITIAIMTSYYINNYGAVLQAFATKEFFESMGVKTVFINYIRENVRNRKITNEKWEDNLIKRIIYKIYRNVDNRLKRKVFASFINKNLNLTQEYEDKKSLYNGKFDADIYCVGSDQMWNSEYNGGVIGENFLDFVPNEKKKISLSTSMGMTSFSDEELEKMKLLLKDFYFISVREKSGMKIISEMGLSNVHQVIDPTLLISGSMWKELLNVRKKHKKYILIYQLNDNPNMQKFTRKLAKKEGLQIIQITYYLSQHWKGIKSLYNPSVEKFVSLIANASYVVTDSFHGTAFSINLHKEFFAFPPTKYADRIYSILSLTGLDNRLVCDIQNYKIPDLINYKDIERVLDICRENAIALVTDAIK